MIPKKRFWTSVNVTPVEAGFEVRLDDRALNTPAKSSIVLPNAQLADLLAEEWSAIEAEITPSAMPATRMTNSAIDTVAVRKDEVVEMLAAYADSDLLCYFAEGPDPLVMQQAALWQPVLDWVAERYKTPVATTAGLMPVPQDPRLTVAVQDELMTLSPFQLAGLHDVIVLSGSMFLALAWFDEKCTLDEAWAASRVDANWQIAQWGEDEDEARIVEQKWSDFQFAAKYCRLAQNSA